jgi:uncharacterized glyoxalase superfamily protein PhnB
MSTPSPHITPKTSIAPMLSVRRGAQAIEFYQTALGATVLYRIDTPDGAVVAQLPPAAQSSGSLTSLPSI